MTIFRHLAAALACAAVPAAAAAPQFEPLDRLEAGIVSTLGAPIGQAGGPAQPIDRRLKLAACPQSPEIAVPTPASAIVRCSEMGWQIYVPLVRKAAAQAEGTAVPLVRKGDEVELVVNGDGFTVTSAAVAQQDGAQGELIRVRASPKSAPVTGQVSRRGQVVMADLSSRQTDR